MSAHAESHDHHDHDHHDDEVVSHSTLGGYLLGFFLAVVLTAIPFWLVMGKVVPDTRTLSVILLAFAAIQIVVHMIYFLHMDTKSQGGWNMLALIFTLVLVVITLSGSIWVMFHMNANMMPGMSHDMSQQVKNLP
ncbi:cytochrome o ubiquinol oxidase operon protein cyoD [Luteibacter sp. 621]|uniref:cytochrome o ubiquinol oxidase subunit IV n=1 Tax=Luteibacter sp. 621 TaxID=3373916 RepID=UPI003D1FED7F